MNAIASPAPDEPDEPSPPDACRIEVRPVPIHWNPLLRIGFRFCFCYFALWIVCNGNASVWGAIPVWGDKIGHWIRWPLAQLAALTGKHLLYLPASEAAWAPTGSGDTALDWVLTGLFVALALCATMVWSLLDRRRRQYQTLLAWLVFALRLTLATAMLIYGFAKLFPLQMPPPLLITLAEPVGQMSPMALLWTMIGSSAHYEMICGSAEIACGVLLLVRRTALAGAMLTVFVATNIVLYNFFFDVPVKIFSLHLLLGALFCVLPNARALFRFFWLHVPSAPASVWVPPTERKAFRRATIAVEAGFLVLVIGQQLWGDMQGYHHVYGFAGTHSPMQGAWTIQDADAGQDAQPLFKGMQKIFIDRAMGENMFLAVAEGAGDRRMGMPVTVDPAKHQIQVPGPPDAHLFAFAMNGNDQIQLTGLRRNGSPGGAALLLQRIPLPRQWPLLTRGFHLVSQSPYQR